MPSSYQRIISNPGFQAPAHWLRIRTVDMHTGGEPLRVVVGGFPELTGDNVLAYRQEARQKYDHLRRALMHEPRGHADMYGCLLTPPNDEGADFGIIFMHNEGYSTMCGHAIIAIAKLAVQMGWVKMKKPVTEIAIDAPCGRIRAFVEIEEGQPKAVTFHGVPSFVVAFDATVEVPGLGRITYDLAYGGAYYAYVDARKIDLSLAPANYRRLISAGIAVKQAVIAGGIPTEHPFEQDLSFLYGTIFIGDAESANAGSRNVCIFADGEVDRSPTGSGVMGRLAIHYARKEIEIGEPIVVESITGSAFSGAVVRETTYGPYASVIPEVTGTAFVTGQHEFLIDPEDPFRYGFFLR